MAVVEKFHMWIEEIGKPAIKKVSEMQLKMLDKKREIEQLRVRLQTVTEELEEYEMEISLLKRENKEYQQEISFTSRKNSEDILLKYSLTQQKSDEEMEDMQNKMYKLQMNVRKSNENIHLKDDENIHLFNINQQLLDKNTLYYDKIKGYERQVNKQDRKIFSLQTKLQKCSETIAYQKLTINTLENEAQFYVHFYIFSFFFLILINCANSMVE